LGNATRDDDAQSTAGEGGKVKDISRYRLMIPGPAGASPEALAEMGKPVVAHYGADWVGIYRETLGLARQVFQTEGDIFLIPGSGSAGLEAAVCSVVGEDFRLLIPVNGEYGARLSILARAYSGAVEVLESCAEEPWSVQQVEERLERNPSIRAVAAVQCESATGIVNPIRELAELCRERHILLIVDAVSSLGGMELAMDEWGVTVCVTASQKCLECPPGLSLVAVADEAWTRIRSRDRAVGWYLNLAVWKEYSEKWPDWHPYPVTLCTNTILALRRSLGSIVDETLERRFERHRTAARMLRRGLRNLGFTLFADDKWASPTVTSVLVDNRISADALLRLVRERHGIILAGSGGDEFEGKVFRVGHMGIEATPEAIVAVLLAIEDALQDVGVRVLPGQCLDGICAFGAAA
jgi:alanine-glyoxylate transaminase/serine-glyoxylate transaminase/serine-pyruvate transaminase